MPIPSGKTWPALCRPRPERGVRRGGCGGGGHIWNSSLEQTSGKNQKWGTITAFGSQNKKDTNGYEQSKCPDAGAEAERGCAGEFYKHVRHPRSRPVAPPVPVLSEPSAGQVEPFRAGFFIYSIEKSGLSSYGNR